MNRKLSNSGLFLFAILSVVIMMQYASAAPGIAVLQTPATGATIGGTGTLNVTITNQAGNFSCNFYAGSALSANTTWTLIAGPISNNTAGFGVAQGINLTYSTTILQDANDYQFNSTCYNNTGLWTDDVNTGITVDNGVPSTPTTLLPLTNNLNATAGDVVYSATVVGQNTTACTIFLGIGGGNYASFAMTHSGNTCSYADTRYTSSAANGLYYWYVTASDGTNSSAASATNINNVQINGGGGGGGGNSGTGGGSGSGTVGTSGSNGLLGIPGIAIVGIVALAFVLYLFNKKR